MDHRIFGGPFFNWLDGWGFISHITECWGGRITGQ